MFLSLSVGKVGGRRTLRFAYAGNRTGGECKNPARNRETVKPPEQNKTDFNAFGRIETGLRLYLALNLFSVG